MPLCMQFTITFLAGNKYPDSHHSQGGMKFISPLLKYYKLFTDTKEDNL